MAKKVHLKVFCVFLRWKFDNAEKIEEWEEEWEVDEQICCCCRKRFAEKLAEAEAEANSKTNKRIRIT